MLIQTKFLGEIDIEEQDIITFELGLPGFPAYTKYTLLGLDADVPMALLQCVENVELGFLVVLPYVFKTDYAFDLSEEDIHELQIKEEQDVITYAILTLQETLTESTMNLLAPIVINTKQKLGKQIVLTESEKYPIRYPLAIAQGSAK